MIRIADLFSGGGGAAMGLHLAMPDAEIVGVDIKPQPHYPFEFVQGDIKDIPIDLTKFDLIWSSPPCQEFSPLKNGTGKNYPNLIFFTRKILEESGKPYVIENVPGAPLKKDLILSGNMFNLGVLRKRIFEIKNFHVCQPIIRNKNGSVRQGRYVTVCGHGSVRDGTTKKWKKAMRINWLTLRELTQAVPPAYSKYIGKWFLFSQGILSDPWGEFYV